MSPQTNSLQTAPHTPLTFKQISENYPAFTVGSLRWLRFNGNTNGFNECIVKVGKRVLVDPDRFSAWLDNQRES